jgi:T5SS/PEP-CTERM-associated repeat protein
MKLEFRINRNLRVTNSFINPSSGLAVLLAGWLLATNVFAAGTWDGEAGDGLWSSAENWDNDAVPASGNINIANGDTVNYDLGTVTTIQALNIGQASPAVGSLTITSGGLNATGNFVIGNTGSGSLTIGSGATVTKANATLNTATGNGGNGTITINQGGKFTIDGVANHTFNLATGANSTGVLNLGGELILGSGAYTQTLNFGGHNTGAATINLTGGILKRAEGATGAIAFNLGQNNANGANLYKSAVTGYGTIDLGVNSTATIVGKVTANGGLLKITAATLAAATAVNKNDGSTHLGWYAQSGGTLLLDIPASVSGGNLTLGAATTATAGKASLVNSFYANNATGNAAKLSLIGSSGDNLLSYGVEAVGGDLSFDTFNIRYDESDVTLVAGLGDLGGDYQFLFNGTDITSSITLDSSNYLISYSGVALDINSGATGLFTIAQIPEPSTILLLLPGIGIIILLRRQRQARNNSCPALNASRQEIASS